MVTADNADGMAEAVATAPGPLGDSMPPEEWFDGLVIGYLGTAWEQHAAAVDRGVRAVTMVCLSPFLESCADVARSCTQASRESAGD